MFALGKACSVIYAILQFTIRWQWIAPCKRLMSSKVFLQNHASHTHIRHICHLNCLQVILSFFILNITWHLSNIQLKISALVRNWSFSSGRLIVIYVTFWRSSQKLARPRCITLPWFSHTIASFFRWSSSLLYRFCFVHCNIHSITFSHKKSSHLVLTAQRENS